MNNSGSGFVPKFERDKYQQDKVFFHNNSIKGIAQKRHYSIEAPNQADSYGKL